VPLRIFPEINGAHCLPCFYINLIHFDLLDNKTLKTNKMKKSAILLLTLSFLIVSCKPKPTSESEASPAEASVSFTETWASDTVFLTPESVLYSPDKNILFVSNINGQPTKKDNNGFISTIGPDGTIIDLEYVTGLHAPKGMGLYDEKLFVTDITDLVIIDYSSATITDRIPVEEAVFLNDIAIDTDGTVYFTDSRTHKIHTYKDGEVSEWITEGLEGPNGLFIEDEVVLLTSMGSSDLKSISKATGEMATITTEIGAGDGVEFSGYEGYYVTSDWNGEVFLINPDFSKTSLIKTKDQEISSADIGLNPENHMVFVPTFFDNRVVAYKLEIE